MNPKVKTMKEEKIRARFLIRNISGVRRACWSSGMGIGMSDKHVNYSYQSTQTKQQVGQCIVGAFLVHEQAAGIHEFPIFTIVRTWGSHHHPPYNILYDSPRGLHSNDIILGTPKLGVSQFLKLGLLPLYTPITSSTNLRLR